VCSSDLLTSDNLASITANLTDNLDQIKQMLHVTPTAFANFISIYEPAHGALTGSLASTNFSDPISFLCGGIQAAAKLGAQQSSKLCVQYLAPILKNRQYNFLPFGENLLVGAIARPNEITYSEDWMRPDYNPAAHPAPAGPLPAGAPPVPADSPAPPAPALAAEAPNPPKSPAPADPGPGSAPAATDTTATDPAAGLPGIMVPHGAGS
jgi:phospholipid/cholesterol/gamma-HCH transport system substrate-binding protein